MSYADAYESRNSRAKAAISQNQRGHLARRSALVF
jgi:hypothetical protein